MHKDCFAYSNISGKPSCLALDALYCREEECAFYKSKKKAKTIKCKNCKGTGVVPSMRYSNRKVICPVCNGKKEILKI